MTVWFLVLATAGAVAEFVGVALIALDIRDSRRQARRILHRHQRVYPGVAPAFAKVNLPTFSMALTAEERLDALEDRIAALDERMGHSILELRDEIREVAEDAASRAGLSRRRLRSPP